MTQSATHSSNREILRLTGAAHPDLVLHLQVATLPISSNKLSGDVLYVHGATFGADLSVFFPLDGCSWADEFSGLGLNVWALDFAGYGQSAAYDKTSGRPVGRIGDVVPQLSAAIHAIRQRNGNQPLSLVSHSWGASVAARYAATYPQDVKALVLFAPIVARAISASAPGANAPASGAAPPPVVFPLSVWAQYRRFVEDVPRGQAQVFSEAHFEAWGAAYLASDSTSGDRCPASVITPFGPVADIGAMWSGQAQYDATKIVAPTLLIRGAWDTLCTDTDAATLMSQLGSIDKVDAKIQKATHLMHLETGRLELRREVNSFLKRQGCFEASPAASS